MKDEEPRFRGLVAPAGIALGGCLLVAAVLLTLAVVLLALFLGALGDVFREIGKAFD